MNIEKYSKLHEKLFPNATAESQFYKLEEEIAEFKAAVGEDSIKELADIWIVCAGLHRWFPETAYAVYSYYSDDIINAQYGLDKIESEVNRKWQINLKRKWEWNGKTYKHIGKDGNE